MGSLAEGRLIMIIETTATADPVPARRRPVLVTLSLAYLLCTLAGWFAMREYGDRHWMGTVLLLSPRWVLAIPLVVLWPWALVARAKGVLLIVGAASVSLLWLVLGMTVSVPQGSDRRGDVRLLTCNIHRQNLDAPRMLAYLGEIKPDVVALQGWSEIHKDSLFLDGWEVRRLGELLIASHFPIISVTPIEFEDDPSIPRGEQGAAAVFELQTPRGIVHLISLHLASPHLGLNTMWSDHGAKLETNIRRRGEESSHVREVAEGISGPLLITGDFNTVSESPMFREHWGGLTDAFNTCGLGLGYTYFNHTTQIRIDHILGDDSVQFENCWVGPDVHAAHHPLIADITIR
jgi:endonuclease/exonuclease/phosphatase (EEP) superfamily protein YafD